MKILTLKYVLLDDITAGDQDIEQMLYDWQDRSEAQYMDLIRLESILDEMLEDNDEAEPYFKLALARIKEALGVGAEYVEMETY